MNKIIKLTLLTLVAFAATAIQSAEKISENFQARLKLQNFLKQATKIENLIDDDMRQKNDTELKKILDDSHELCGQDFLEQWIDRLNYQSSTFRVIHDLPSVTINRVPEIGEITASNSRKAYRVYRGAEHFASILSEYIPGSGAQKSLFRFTDDHTSLEGGLTSLSWCPLEHIKDLLINGASPFKKHYKPINECRTPLEIAIRNIHDLYQYQNKKVYVDDSDSERQAQHKAIVDFRLERARAFVNMFFVRKDDKTQEEYVKELDAIIQNFKDQQEMKEIVNILKAELIELKRRSKL